MQSEALRQAHTRILARIREQGSEASISEAIAAECPANDALASRITAEFNGWGPLEPWIEDPSISEIIVNGYDKIWLERQGQLEAANDRFVSALSFENFIHRLTAEAGVSIDLNIPCADGRWKDFRLHLIRPPLADEIQLSLRRHPKQPWTLERLRHAGWASQSAIALLCQLVVERKNFLVVGPTGSGKTSVLNACLFELTSNERALCIEDTSELTLPNQASCKLLTRFDQNNVLRSYDLSDLVRQSLRMRPSRLIMGEVRGAEARDLLLALATGHSGSMGTLHAEGARQALLRLEMLVQLGASSWNPDAIRQLIQLSLENVVVVQKKNGKRSLEGIYRIASLEKMGFLLEKMDA